MISFVDYKKKFYPNISVMRAWEIYNKYLDGEEEIMAGFESNQVNSAKKALKAAKIPLANCTEVAPPANSVCVKVSGLGVWQLPVAEKTKEVENTMTTANSERDYLNRRLTDARYTKRTEMEKHYHIYDSTEPTNFKELLDWIKNDKFKINKKVEKQIENIEASEGECYYGPFHGIEWTGRIEKDTDGYHAAVKELDKQFTSAKDVINTDDAKEGLKALNEFEAWFPKGFKKH